MKILHVIQNLEKEKGGRVTERNIKLIEYLEKKNIINYILSLKSNINNNPSEDHMNNLKELCINELQRVRDHFGRVVSVSSGYRSPELCIAIGSSINSQHAKGQAADFEIPGISNKELAEHIRENLNFDQLILEFHTTDDPMSGWVHCSYNNKEENRKQFLRAYKDNGKTKYEMYDEG